MNINKNRISVKSAQLYAYLFFGGVFSNVVLPSFYFGINWHPALIFSLIISFFIVFDGAKTGDVKIVRWALFPVGLFFLVFISDLYGKSFLGVTGDYSPLLNALLLLFTFIPYFFAMSRISQDVGDRIFIRIANISFSVLFFVAVMQAWGPQELSALLINIYAQGIHESVALDGLRYTLTGPDPNVGSAIVAFFIIFYFVLFLKFYRLKYFVLFFTSLVPLFLAQGRTVMIGLGVCFFFYFWFFSKISLLYKILSFIVLAPLILYFATLLEVEYLTGGLSELARGENNSFNIRLQNVLIVFDSFWESPFIGQGANLEQYGLVKNLDSEYLLLLQRHGALGLTFVLGVFLYMAIVSLKGLGEYWGAHVLLLLCGLAAFVMLTNVFVFNVDTFGYVLLMVYLTRLSKFWKHYKQQSQFVRG